MRKNPAFLMIFNTVLSTLSRLFRVGPASSILISSWLSRRGQILSNTATLLFEVFNRWKRACCNSGHEAKYSPKLPVERPTPACISGDPHLLLLCGARREYYNNFGRGDVHNKSSRNEYFNCHFQTAMTLSAFKGICDDADCLSFYV